LPFRVVLKKGARLVGELDRHRSAQEMPAQVIGDEGHSVCNRIHAYDSLRWNLFERRIGAHGMKDLDSALHFIVILVLDGNVIRMRFSYVVLPSS
jgi:hypothetical protein